MDDLELAKIVEVKDHLRRLLNTLRRLSVAKKSGSYKELALQLDETIHEYDTMMTDITTNYLD